MKNSCRILQHPTIRRIMVKSMKYSYNVQREMYYNICNTKRGIAVTSPKFGSKENVSSEHLYNACKNEFPTSVPILGFHTHPIISNDKNDPEFSHGDIESMIISSSEDYKLPSNYINCIVQPLDVKIGKNRRKTIINARCTRNIDAMTFLINTPELHGSGKNVFENAFYRLLNKNPRIQDKFSCKEIIDIQD